MTNVFLIMLASILTENFIFVRFLGVRPFASASDKPKRAVATGILMTLVMTISSVATYGAYHYALVPAGLEILKTMVFILIIFGIGQLLGLILGKCVPSVYALICEDLHIISTGCAVPGAVLMNIQEQSSFAGSAIFGLSCGLGFTLAIIIFAGVRAKLAFSEPPKAFRGAPILLIAAGLVAMIFAGFAGIKFN